MSCSRFTALLSQARAAVEGRTIEESCSGPAHRVFETSFVLVVGIGRVKGLQMQRQQTAKKQFFDNDQLLQKSGSA